MKDPDNGAGKTVEAAASPAAVAVRSLQLPRTPVKGQGYAGRRRWILAAGGAAVAACLTFCGYRAVADVPEVEGFTCSAPPAREILLDVSGFVVPREKVNVAPRVGGVVVEVHIEEGKAVRKGDLLVAIDDVRYRAEFEQARAAVAGAEARLRELQNGSLPEEIEQNRAQVAQARAQVELTRAELARAQRMFAGGAIGASEFDRARKGHDEAVATLRLQSAALALAEKGPREERLAAARADVEAARAALDRARYNLDKTQICAPVDGVVLEKKVAVGEIIQADLVFTTLCVLADPSSLEVEIEVPERDLRHPHIGSPCEIIPDAYPDRVYHGRLARMQPQVHRQRGAVTMWVRVLDPDSRLLADMNCRVLMLRDSPTSDEPALLQIPQRAVVPGGGPPAVFVLEGRAARLRAVRLGSAGGEMVAVRDGLQPGDVVLLPGRDSLQDGQSVRTRQVRKEP